MLLNTSALVSSISNVSTKSSFLLKGVIGCLFLWGRLVFFFVFFSGFFLFILIMASRSSVVLFACFPRSAFISSLSVYVVLHCVYFVAKNGLVICEDLK